MELESFVFAAVLVLIATSISVAIFKQFGMGSILGLLVAGVVLGPYSPGLKVTDHVEDLRHFTEIGVVLLLFIIGLEQKPKRLWGLRKELFGMGSLQILITGLGIMGYAFFFTDSWQQALLIGMTFSISSTAFVMQWLQEKGEIATRHGSIAFSILLMQDLAIVPMLAIIPLISPISSLSMNIPLWQKILILVGMLSLVFVFGRYVVPYILVRLSRQANREGFFLVVMLAVFLACWAVSKAGISMALGAFLMGLLLSNSKFKIQIQALVEPFKGLLMSLFFVAVGMSIDIGVLTQIPITLGQHLLVIWGLKILILIGICLIFKKSKDVAHKTTFLLANGGEFGFVMLGSAKALKLIDDSFFVTWLGVLSLTLLFAPLLVQLGEFLGNRIGHINPKLPKDQFTPLEDGEVPKVVIGGYGRVGHTVGALLKSSGIPYIAFDTDLKQVAKGKEEEYNVYFGDISDPKLLVAANIGQAKLVLLTIDNGGKALRAVHHIRQEFPGLPIIVRAKDLKHCGHLRKAGATHAFPETIEASLNIGAKTLEMIGVPVDNVSLLMNDMRRENYTMVKSSSKN